MTKLRSRHHRFSRFAVPSVLVALALAGCGEDGGTSTTPAPAPAPPPAPPPPEPEPPTAPVGLHISATGPSFIEWSWMPVLGASGYDVQFGTNAAFTDENQVIARRAEQIWYRQEGLAAETSGYLRVRSATGAGDERLTSDWSASLHGMTAVAVEPPVSPDFPPASTGPERCVNGRAGDFPCDGVSLRSQIDPDVMGGTYGSDLWGWSDGQGGPEYALMGLDTGTAFVDVSNPEDPLFLGRLPTETEASHWRDIKVYRDHAYIVADHAGAHGMQVFDLARLRGTEAPRTFDADFVYREFGPAHNVAINEETGFAYVVSSDTCGMGLHIVDLRVPANPQFRGCHAAAPVHDVQCVVYRGDDAEHLDREICVTANHDHLAVVDVTDKSAPRILSSTVYPEFAYVHQGWLTADHRFFLLGDEADELDFGVPTRMHVFDLSDLDAPAYLFPHELETRATDHNLYVRGNLVFAANYMSGLRVLEIGDLANRELRGGRLLRHVPGIRRRRL